ncbi:MAG: hypothetical protein HY060_08450 [Proteobacteria bacterium]|nr:hypothetical protein [Pseudomonadota bacterium]
MSEDAAAAPRPLWRVTLGVICLNAAFAGLIALAAHPPQRSPQVRLALPPDPSALAAASEVHVARAAAERAPPAPPREPPVARGVTVTIRPPAPRVPDIAMLADGAGNARPRAATAVDRIGVAPPRRAPPIG